MAKKGSSKKAVYVTHKKQTAIQRRINKATGVREANGRTKRDAFNFFRRKSAGGQGG